MSRAELFVAGEVVGVADAVGIEYREIDDGEVGERIGEVCEDRATCVFFREKEESRRETRCAGMGNVQEEQENVRRKWLESSAVDGVKARL